MSVLTVHWFVGTPFYCAPELVYEKRLLPASDIFSFGVIMWEVRFDDCVFKIKSKIVRILDPMNTTLSNENK